MECKTQSGILSNQREKPLKKLKALRDGKRPRFESWYPDIENQRVMSLLITLFYFRCKHGVNNAYGNYFSCLAD